MMVWDIPTLLAVGATFGLAGFVKGVIGLGLPTIAMGLLGLALPPAQAAALLVLPSAVTNLWQLAAGPSLGGLLRRLWPLFAGAILGISFGAGWLAKGGTGTRVALGLALSAYAALGLSKVRLAIPPRIETLASPLVGLATGLVTAATGVFVIPAVPYLQALGLDKEDLIQALGLSFMVSTLALAAVLWRDGALGIPALGGSLLALAPALGGMALGTALRGRVRAETFRLCFLLGLLLLGIYLALSALA
jgi:uncharacterized membrane protein YfcA